MSNPENHQTVVPAEVLQSAREAQQAMLSEGRALPSQAPLSREDQIASHLTRAAQFEAMAAAYLAGMGQQVAQGLAASAHR
jgi:hypothetical protein